MMKSLGYITLSEAEQLSGIKADTWKKRCQDGKVVGAIKQGKTWFIPRDSVLKSPDLPQADVVLNTIVTLAEAGLHLNVTLIVKGLVLTGRVISAKEYFDRTKDTLHSATWNKKVPEVTTFFDKLLDLYLGHIPKDPKEIFDTQWTKLHLDDVRTFSNGGLVPFNNGLLRVKLDAVDGFFWGEMSVGQT